EANGGGRDPVESTVDPKPPRRGVGPRVTVDRGAKRVKHPPRRYSTRPGTGSLRSWENAAALTQPSATPIAAESHFGARNQKSFNSVAPTAPVQTIVITGTAQSSDITSNLNGVYVPAISRKTPAWSRRESHTRTGGLQVGR